MSEEFSRTRREVVQYRIDAGLSPEEAEQVVAAAPGLRREDGSEVPRCVVHFLGVPNYFWSTLFRNGEYRPAGCTCELMPGMTTDTNGLIFYPTASNR